MEAKHPMLPYRIFDDGSMLKTRGSGFKKMTKGTGGYSQFSCYGKVWLAHRVIWEAFNGEIPDGFQINHIDGNKANNQLTNLELVTPSENIRHAIQISLKPPSKAEDNGMAKLTNAQYLMLIQDIVDGLDNAEIGLKYGLHSRYVSLIRHKKRLFSIWNQYESLNGITKTINSRGLNSKIPIETRIEVIKKLSTCSNKELAIQLGIDPSQISNVRYKKAWLDAWDVVESEGATTSREA
jgi:hypothetical protein